MRLSRLEKVTLKKVDKIKQPNGTYKNTYNNIKDYNCQLQEINDEVSSSIYGASINKMLRIRTPLQTLEKYLKTKVNNKEDNISLYFIFIDDVSYKIGSIKNKWIDIERL